MIQKYFLPVEKFKKLFKQDVNRKKISMNLFISILILFFAISTPVKSADIYKITRAEKRIVLTGFTRSETMMTLSSEVSGKVLVVNYDIGDIITKKPFVSIDPTFINFQIDQTRQSIKEIQVAEKMAEQNIRYLKKEFDRIDFLHKGDRATEVKLDAAENSLVQSRLERDELSVKRRMLEITLQELNEKKQRHHIFAPKGWIVVNRNVEIGEIIGPEAQLAQVADYQNLVVPLAVSSKELDAIQRLPKIFFANVNDKSVKARINWVNPEFNEHTRKLSIEIRLIEYDGVKRGGLSFSLPLNVQIDGLLVPKPAITRRYDNSRITLKTTGKAINVEVLGESSDHVIIANDSRLKPGIEIMPSQ